MVVPQLPSQMQLEGERWLEAAGFSHVSDLTLPAIAHAMKAGAMHKRL
jgi:hypothetical protein